MAKRSDLLDRKGIQVRLKTVRSSYGLSQEAFANGLSLRPSQYGLFENGSSIVPSEVLVRLYEYFVVDPLWLLTGKGHMFTSPDRESTSGQTVVPRLEVYIKGQLQTLPAVKSAKTGAEDDVADRNRQSSRANYAYVKMALELEGLSFNDVAAAAGVRVNTVYAVCAGKARSQNIEAAVCRLLDRTPEDLWGYVSTSPADETTKALSSYR
jgi:transcriptional regulator with XRE-family HTH domain